MTKPKPTKCPTCGGVSTKEGNKVFPFCGERCQLVDLGRWLNEDYRVPAEPADPEEVAEGLANVLDRAAPERKRD